MAIHFLLAFLLLAMAPLSSGTFCVCKPGVNPAMMQKAIDYACGAGADCNPIRPNGPCYNPGNIVQHCSYAVNSYYQRNAAKGATCVFDGTATPTNQDPSSGSCSFSAASSGSTSTGTATTVPTTSPTTPTSTPVTGVTPVSGTGVNPVSGTGMNPTTASPYTASPNSGTGVLGGVGTGMAPTGTGFDDSDGGIKIQTMNIGSILMTLVTLIIMIMRN